jgi:hypothetical protein
MADTLASRVAVRIVQGNTAPFKLAAGRYRMVATAIEPGGASLHLVERGPQQQRQDVLDETGRPIGFDTNDKVRWARLPAIEAYFTTTGEIHAGATVTFEPFPN